MAETGAITSTVAHQIGSEQPSKEDLQRRMEEAREAISGTVNEIKDSVVHQYEVVKDTLDWREQFKKRPVVMSVGALGAGAAMGWVITSLMKPKHPIVGFAPPQRSPQVGRPEPQPQHEVSHHHNKERLIKKIAATPVYQEIRKEGASLGRSLLEDLSKIGHEVLIPAISGKIREWLQEELGDDSSASRKRTQQPDLVH